MRILLASPARRARVAAAFDALDVCAVIVREPNVVALMGVRMRESLTHAAVLGYLRAACVSL